MKKQFEQYFHHGKSVWVNSELKGKHREHCLCHSCKWFSPDNRNENCHRANLLYSFDVLTDMVTPVFECPIFEEKPDKERTI